jgi:hypothetical protein
VGLEELASIREGDPVHGGGRVDLATGDVWHQSPFAEPIDDSEFALITSGIERWLELRPDPAGWRDFPAILDRRFAQR